MTYSDPVMKTAATPIFCDRDIFKPDIATSGTTKMYKSVVRFRAPWALLILLIIITPVGLFGMAIHMAIITI
jgi:hypothetical protein